MNPAPTPSLAALVRAQHGVITRAQLLEGGMSASTVRRRVSDGSLVRVGARSFRLSTAVATTRSDLMAACLDRAAGASHRSGAWLLGVGPEPVVLEVTVVKGRPTRVPLSSGRMLRIHASTNLPADDIVAVDGIPTTNLARTLLGVAALVPDEVAHGELVEMVALSIEKGLATMAWLRWMLEQRRCRGRNGVAALERALDARDLIGPTESWLERHFVRLLDAAGLARPVLQRRIARRSGRAARVDFLYEANDLVIEVLGYAYHRTPEQIGADTMRANELQLCGLTVLQFTSRTIEEAPSEVVALVRAALLRPSARRSTSPF